ncbi:MAG TPA: BlaI/MecI/CopY family transcriptional regulator [Pirellulales bacterium]|jgi:predicted transcriptional regulator|nr:BlaI/MecI/CopY family transcriptional regulator [Pirellulales bacterium]
MTKRSPPARLSAGEMEMLEMLWRLGPVALSEAHAGLGRAIGYTTVQTRLNRLVEKRLATRSADRPAKYAAAVLPTQVSAGHLDLLLERVSVGSVVPLVAHLVRDRRLSAEEITELKQLIADAEQAERKVGGNRPRGGARSR